MGETGRDNLGDGCSLPIETRGIGKPRVTWSPIVHSYYREECFFILVRIRSSWRRAEAAFHKCFEDSGVKAYSIYPLYGYYDALIRAWANPYRRSKLAKAFSKLEEILDYASDFQVDEIDYTWQERRGNQVTVAPFVNDIQSVTEGFSKGGCSSKFGESYKRLTQSGLLLEHGDGERSVIKLYILVRQVEVTSSFTNRDLREALEKFKSEQEQRGNGLESISFYFGKGFGRVLVKGIVEDYANIYPIVDSLERSIQPNSGLKCSTLLIAGSEIFESEQLVIEHGGVTKASQEMLDLFDDPVVHDTFVGLVPTIQADIEEFFQNHAKFLDTPFSDVFLAVIRYRITGEKLQLMRSLSFVMEFEYLVRDFLIRTFAKFLGSKTWASELMDFIERDPKLNVSASSPAKFNLGELVRVAYEIGKDREDISEGLQQVLGDKWYGLMNELTELRNDIAHGRVYAEGFEFPGGDERSINIIMKIGDLYCKLKG